jgi:hypothetical protein
MDIEREIAVLQERNARVEADKAWETSAARKLCLVVLTYILACLLMGASGVERPYIGALVPTLGFYLSTLSLGFAKSLWIKNRYQKNRV